MTSRWSIEPVPDKGFCVYVHDTQIDQPKARADRMAALERGADRRMVDADQHEERGDRAAARASSNEAGRCLEAIAWMHFGDADRSRGLATETAIPWRNAGDFWHRASVCYRRGMSHQRASFSEGRALFAWTRASSLMVRR